MSDQGAAATERSKHGREQYVIEGEGTFPTDGASRAALAVDEAPPFRFSRLGPQGRRLDARSGARWPGR